MFPSLVTGNPQSMASNCLLAIRHVGHPKEVIQLQNSYWQALSTLCPELKAKSSLERRVGFVFVTSLLAVTFSRTYSSIPFLLACPLLPPTLWDQSIQDTDAG